MTYELLDTSVVICTHTEERWDDLVASIESVRRQTVPAREIIVVVDHNEALQERIARTMADVIVVANREQRGASGSKNRGVDVASSAIVVFLDDDAVAEPDWLQHLCVAYADSGVLGVGGCIEPHWPGPRPAWFPEEFHWVVGCTYRGLPKQNAAVRNLIGANMSFRREVFHQVRFHHGIGHIGSRPFGGSDPDFCIRVQQQWPEKHMLYVPQARVYHRVSQKRTRWHYFCLRCYNEGLSKALLTQRVGSKEGLSSERSYTLRTLPRGVLRGAADVVLRGDLSGARRSGAIIAGLLITTAGYVRGTIAQWITLKRASGRKEAAV